MSKTFSQNGVQYKLNIWDTAGQERVTRDHCTCTTRDSHVLQYRALAPMYYRQAAVCVVVYDVTQRVSRREHVSRALTTCRPQETFTAVRAWIRELRAHLKSDDCLLVICGNKCDLERAVAPHEARELAEHVGAMFWETSAKNDKNVFQMFLKIG